jgi:hypothetical protein
MEWFTKLKTTKDPKTGNSGLAKHFFDEEPNSKVLETAYKITRRRPKWMDALTISSQQGYAQSVPTKGNAKQATYFSVENYLKEEKRILSIRINAEGREYGLFLSYLLKEIFKLRVTNKIKPTLIVIDEAQDIFNGSRAVRSTAEATINDHLRKGRSKQIGFVFSVQSAGEIPETILSNLNSRIIHRQNTDEDIKSAIPNAPKELVQTTLSFGPGEALVNLFKSRSTVHAEMAPSPFMLTKDMQASQATMGDQVKEFSNLVEDSGEAKPEDEFEVVSEQIADIQPPDEDDLPF